MENARIHPVARKMARDCRRLHRMGFAPATLTHVSVREADLWWFTPPGADIGEIQPEDLLLVAPPDWVVPDRDHVPPERLAFHQALYGQYPAINAVLTTRPPYAITLLSQRQGVPSELWLPGCPLPILPISALPAVSTKDPNIDSGRDSNMGPNPWPDGHALLYCPQDGVISPGASLAEAIQQIEILESAALMAHLSHAHPLPAR